MHTSRILSLGPFLRGELIDYHAGLESSLGEYVRAVLGLEGSHSELVWIVRDYVDALGRAAPEGVTIGFGPIFVHHHMMGRLGEIRRELLCVDLAEIAAAERHPL